MSDHNSSVVAQVDAPGQATSTSTMIVSEMDAASHFSEGELVTIHIGPSKKAFHIHKQLLCEKIPYFKTCLKKHWHNSEGKPVELKEIDLEGFRLIVRWLFNEDLSRYLRSGANVGVLDWSLFIRVYQVSDRLMATELQNKLIDNCLQIMCETNHNCSFQVLEMLMEHDLEHTPLYQLALKSLARAFAEGYTQKKIVLNSIADLSDPTVLRQALTVIYEYIKAPWNLVWDMDRCEFHIHEKGVNCARK